MTTPKLAPRWTTSNIQLFADTATQLYPNGLQQVVITARIQCTNPTMEISEDELKSFRLIRYQGSAPLAESDDAGADWVSSGTDKGYSPYPGAAAPRDHQVGNGIYYKTFYVSTTSTLQTTLKIAVEILRFDEDEGGDVKRYTYRTNREGDNGANPEASLDLRPERIPTFRDDNYTRPRFRVEGPEDDRALDTIDNYYVGVQYDHFGPVELRTFSTTPISLITWQYRMEGNTFASYTGFAEPGSSTPTFADGVNGEGPEPPKQVIQPQPGKGVVILVRRGDVPFYRGGNVEPCAIEAVDAFGNKHRLIVAFEANNRNRLDIRSP